MQQEIAQRPFL